MTATPHKALAGAEVLAQYIKHRRQDEELAERLYQLGVTALLFEFATVAGVAEANRLDPALELGDYGTPLLLLPEIRADLTRDDRRRLDPKSPGFAKALEAHGSVTVEQCVNLILAGRDQAAAVVTETGGDQQTAQACGRLLALEAVKGQFALVRSVSDIFRAASRAAVETAAAWRAALDCPEYETLRPRLEALDTLPVGQAEIFALLFADIETQHRVAESRGAALRTEHAEVLAKIGKLDARARAIALGVGEVVDQAAAIRKDLDGEAPAGKRLVVVKH